MSQIYDVIEIKDEVDSDLEILDDLEDALPAAVIRNKKEGKQATKIDGMSSKSIRKTDNGQRNAASHSGEKPRRRRTGSGDMRDTDLLQSCLFCPQKFSSGFEMGSHILTHLDPNKGQGPSSENQGASLGNLGDTLRKSVSPQKQRSPPKAVSPSVNPNLMSMTLSPNIAKQINVLECQLCSELLRGEEALRQHLLGAHGMNVDIPTTMTPQTPTSDEMLSNHEPLSASINQNSIRKIKVSLSPKKNKSKNNIDDTQLEPGEIELMGKQSSVEKTCNEQEWTLKNCVVLLEKLKEEELLSLSPSKTKKNADSEQQTPSQTDPVSPIETEMTYSDDNDDVVGYVSDVTDDDYDVNNAASEPWKQSKYKQITDATTVTANTEQASKQDAMTSADNDIFEQTKSNRRKSRKRAGSSPKKYLYLECDSDSMELNESFDQSKQDIQTNNLIPSTVIELGTITTKRPMDANDASVKNGQTTPKRRRKGKESNSSPRRSINLRPSEDSSYQDSRVTALNNTNHDEQISKTSLSATNEHWKEEETESIQLHIEQIKGNLDNHSDPDFNPIDSESTSSSPSLSLPLVNHRFKCRYCDTYLRDNYALNRHSQRFHQKFQSMCTKCDKYFTDKSEYLVHAENCQAPKPAKASLSPNIETSKDLNESPRPIRYKEKSRNENKQMSALSISTKRVDKVIKASFSPIIETSKDLNVSPRPTRNIRKNENENKQMSTMSSSIKSVAKEVKKFGYKCNICSQFCRDNYALNRHTTRTHHRNLYMCIECGEYFNIKKRYTKHRENCRGEEAKSSDNPVINATEKQSETGDRETETHKSRKTKNHQKSSKTETHQASRTENQKTTEIQNGGSSETQNKPSSEADVQKASETENKKTDDKQYSETKIQQASETIDETSNEHKAMKILEQYYKEPLEPKSDNKSLDSSATQNQQSTETLDETSNEHQASETSDEDDIESLEPVTSITILDPKVSSDAVVALPTQNAEDADMYRCNKCDKISGTRVELYRHCLTHVSKDGTIQCPRCLKHFTKHSVLYGHLRRCKPPGRYACDLCDKVYDKEHSLQAHIRLKHVMEPEQCDICHKTYPDPYLLQVHKKNVHFKKFKCETCGKTFGTASKLQAHEETHGKPSVPCEYCGKLFTRVKYAQKHAELVHMVKKGNFPCDECGACLSSKWALENHIKGVHGPRDVLCTMCPFQTFSEERLRRHMVSKHSTERPFKCRICPKAFKSKLNLQKHEDTHSDIRPYACDVCGDRFKQPHHLDNHMLKHTGERAFKCSVCDKAFQRKQILETHMLTHTGEMSYECENCGKPFARSWDLNKHYREKEACASKAAIQNM